MSSRLSNRRAPSLVLVNSMVDFDWMIDQIKGTVSYDIETTGLYPWAKGAAINTLGIGTRDADFVIPLAHAESPFNREEQDEIVERVCERLDKCFVVMQNGKFDVLWTWVKYGIRLRNDFDTMLAHYALDENTSHALKDGKGGPGLATRFLRVKDWNIDAKKKKGGGTVRELAMYQAHDLCYTRQLFFVFKERLVDEPAAERVFDHILMPIADIFTDAQYDGIVVDESKFDDAEAYLLGEIKAAEDELNQFARIKWTSTKELGDLLYNKFKLPVKVKTPKGKASTSESALNQLDHPCVSALLRLRGAKQQHSFFIEGWKPWLHRTRTACYLHPSFKTTGTVTGRPSCEMPNLFQVPRDKRIRSLIIAEPGWDFIEADLSQIEMRLAAEVSGDPNLRHAFLNGIDVHWLTALREIERGHGLVPLVMSTAKALKPRLDGKPLTYATAIEMLVIAGPDACASINEEWKEYRKKAKAVNFGYLYGMWWKKFKQYARDNYGVEVTDEQAQQSRTTYFQTYPALSPWHDRQKRFARRNGYVMSLAGRKRRLPGAMDPDEFTASGPLRQAINSPIQSFANDINFMAAFALREKYGRDMVRIIGTVYDAILARVKRPHTEEVMEFLLKTMSRPPLFDVFGIKLSIPILAEGKVGPWGAGIDFHKWKEKQ